MNFLSLPHGLAERLRDSDWRVIITGATGWLGQAALELLSQTLGKSWDERVLAFGSSGRTWALRDGTTIKQYPLDTLPAVSRHPSILLHFAYLTREKASNLVAEDYIATNRKVSHLAVEGGVAAGVTRIFALSSGAVHHALAAPDDPNPSLLYGRLKLEDEALFENFALAVPERRVFLARLFNLSGPYINKLDSYALASFISQARRGRIEIKAQRPVVRSYTSAANLLGAAFGQLLADREEQFVRVETAGEQEVEMGELAKAVCRVVNPQATIERPSFLLDAAADKYVGDGTVYRQLLAKHGVIEHRLEQQIADTEEYLRP